MSPVAFVVGESLIDVIERPDGTVSEHAGGSPMNVAVGLARLGVATRLHTRIGDDPHGAAIGELLRREGVELTSSSVGDRPTSTARALLAVDGSATYEFDIDWSIAHSESGAPAIFHTGSLAACLMPGAETVMAELGEARASATISFDPNIRPSLVGDRRDVVARVERFVEMADLVKASEEDLSWLYPDATVDAALERWLRMGPALVVATLGERGSVARTRTGSVRQLATGRIDDLAADAAWQPTVVDTVGAGDSFMAGLLAAIDDVGLAGRGHVDTLRSLDSPGLGRLTDFAGRCAAVTVSRAGADPPTRADLG